jgi:hypothetical protein
MTVSRDNSMAVYHGIKGTGIRFLTALPENACRFRGVVQSTPEAPRGG